MNNPNLTNNLDFKRAIAQQFDPETDYSTFDEAEIDGAFEATVYQLLLEREGVFFAEGKIKVGDTVTWNYGKGTGTGEVAKIYAKPITLKIGESQITRNGSEENPALLITQGKARVLKLASEVKVTEVVDLSEPLDFGAIIHQVIKWNNLAIGLEYRPGDVRFPGRRNSRKLRSGYGHIRNYIGADGEALDCYLAPTFFDEETPSERLWQVTQISPEDGDFDEFKFLLGYESLDDAKSAYLREMPSDYFGGIKEVAIADLEQYRKPPKSDYSEISSQLLEIKQQLAQPLTFSESMISEILSPYLQKLDDLADKVDNLSSRFAEFAASIQIGGDVLSDEEIEAIATVDERTITSAIGDWEKSAPEKYKELISDGANL